MRGLARPIKVGVVVSERRTGMATANLNGVELYFERVGEGEPIVLTHGALTDGRTWRALTDLLRDRFEVVAWDRRGHSRSKDGQGPGSIRQDADDLAALIQYLGGEPVHLVGNSSGGAVVLRLVTMYPELVKSAAAHEPGPYTLLDGTDDRHIAQLLEAEKRHIARVQDMIARNEHRRAVEYFIDEVAIGPGAWDQFPEELRNILESNTATVADDLRDSFDPHSVDIDSLAGTSIPLLVSTGSESPVLEVAAVKELARLLPAARLQRLVGTGHIPHRTHPDVYAATLIGFIGGVAATTHSSIAGGVA
jgi:pimeloyl-ACP methyl ester carboxylesterase